MKAVKDHMISFGDSLEISIVVLSFIHHLIIKI